jgi:hypothetical protein
MVRVGVGAMQFVPSEVCHRRGDVKPQNAMSISIWNLSEHALQRLTW